MHITYSAQQQTFLLPYLRFCFRRSLRALSSHLMPLWWNGVCRRFPALPELRAWALLRLKWALCMTCNSFRRQTSQCVLMWWFLQPDHAEWSECHKHTYHHVVLQQAGGWGVCGVGGSEKVRMKHCFQSMEPFTVWYLQGTFSSGFHANFCCFSGLKELTEDLLLLKGSHERWIKGFTSCRAVPTLHEEPGSSFSRHASCYIVPLTDCVERLSGNTLGCTMALA